MKNIYKRFILFLFLCIPSRFLLAYISSVLNKKYLFLMGLLALLPAFGWLTLYFFNLRKTGNEVFGDKIWWDNLRPIHAFNYLVFSYLAITGSKYAPLPLYFDVIFGLGSFLIYHFLKN